MSQDDGVVWNVKAVAAQKGITTATALAALTGLHINTTTQLMNGVPIRVDRQTLTRLCDALDCEPGDLLVYQKKGEPVAIAA